MAFTKRLIKGQRLSWAEMDNNLSEIEYLWSEVAGMHQGVLAATNYVGPWNLLSGALSTPAATFHVGLFWLLSTSTADVALHEPGVSSLWVQIPYGNVSGPASAVADELALFDGTTGKLLKASSGVSLSAGVMSGVSDVRGLLALADGNVGGQRNLLLNGTFEHWQRGTSFSVTTVAATFTADRWSVLQQTAATLTVTRQDSSRTDGRFALRVQRNAGSTGVGNISLAQPIEMAACKRARGRKVTLSFKLRVGANFSAVGGNLGVRLRGQEGGTELGSDTIHVGTGWLSNLAPDSTVTPTTTLLQYSTTATVTTTVNQLGVVFFYVPTGTAGANDWFEVEDVQIAVGDYTPLAVQDPTIDLLGCLRHFYRHSAGAGGVYGTGIVTATTTALTEVQFPVPMRAAPTAVLTSGTASDYHLRHNTATTLCSAVPTFSSITNKSALLSSTVASGLTVGQAVLLRGNGANSFLAWSADL